MVVNKSLKGTLAAVRSNSWIDQMGRSTQHHDLATLQIRQHFSFFKGLWAEVMKQMSFSTPSSIFVIL